MNPIITPIFLNSTGHANDGINPHTGYQKPTYNRFSLCLSKRIPLRLADSAIGNSSGHSRKKLLCCKQISDQLNIKKRKSSLIFHNFIFVYLHWDESIRRTFIEDAASSRLSPLARTVFYWLGLLTIFRKKKIEPIWGL